MRLATVSLAVVVAILALVALWQIHPYLVLIVPGVVFIVGLVGVIVGLVVRQAALTFKYRQTWRKAYRDTTCRDWVSRMTDQERFVMAADLLLTFDRHRAPGAPIAPDALVRDFADRIARSCSGVQPDVGERYVWRVAELAYDEERLSSLRLRRTRHGRQRRR